MLDGDLLRFAQDAGIDVEDLKTSKLANIRFWAGPGGATLYIRTDKINTSIEFQPSAVSFGRLLFRLLSTIRTT